MLADREPLLLVRGPSPSGLRAGQVADAVGLAAAVRDADLVLTGEGAVDSQTLEGKTPAGVALVAQRAGVGCIVFAGRVRPGAEVLLEHGVDALVQIVDPDAPLALALAEGPRNLAAATAETLGSWGG